MDSGLTRFINRGIRFALTKASTTFVGIRTAADPVASITFTVPATLPPSTQNVTVDNAGNIGYAAAGIVQARRASFTNAALTSGILTVTHTIGQQFNIIQVYDETNKMIVTTDDVTAISLTSFSIDLTSFGVIAGTWNWVAVG